MIDYIAHLSTNDGAYTACGEPWQGWQAPRSNAIYDRYPHVREVGPQDQPEAHRDSIRQCQACLRVAMVSA